MDWNNINRDRDTSGLGPIEYDQTKVPALVRKHANNVRTKTYGQEVREAQARNAELAGLIAQEANVISKDTESRQDIIEMRYDVVVGAMTEETELLDARVDGAGNTYENLFKRLEIGQNFVNYEMFGAKLDGITDDTEAIQAAHSYANAKGLSVIQHNAKILLNGEVIVKTDTDLTGSEVTTTWQDPNAAGYLRTNSLFNIKGIDQVDITNQVNQTEFTKGAIKIPSLSNVESGTLLIDSTEFDLYRTDGGTSILSNEIKREANKLIKNRYGILNYFLTKDYSTARDFKVYLKKDENNITFKAPQLVLDGARIFSFIKSNHSNVTIVGADLVDLTPNTTTSPIYTYADIRESSNIEIDNLVSEGIGRELKGVGDEGLGYLLQFTHCAKIRISDIYQVDGWGGIDGNYFRDIHMVDSTVRRYGGHANVYDISAENSTIINSVTAQGGGILKLKKVKIVNGSNIATTNTSDTMFSNLNNYAVYTRDDYSGEWDGEIILEDVETVFPNVLVFLPSPKVDNGRTIVRPSVEIKKAKMLNKLNTPVMGVKHGANTSHSSKFGNYKVEDLTISGINRQRVIGALGLNTASEDGAIRIEIKNFNPSVMSFASNLWSNENMNLEVGPIPDGKFINYVVENSILNIYFTGTSNVDIDVRNCSIYTLMTTAENITTNGTSASVRFDKSVLYRPNCNTNSFATKDRVIYEVNDCKYRKDISRNPNIGDVFGETIVRSIGNVGVVDPSVTYFNKNKLFNYINPNNFINS